ncbi:MAG: hypothetical protein OFPII_10220 [Osedax symbiont Rs1]|nr:MAG: hypothetical protein OFPII_10220 [Osedax symbiont Rs1]
MNWQLRLFDLVLKTISFVFFIATDSGLAFLLHTKQSAMFE